MRRVFDDTMFETAKVKIDKAFCQCRPEKVSKYSWGMNRSEPRLIEAEVLRILNADGNLYKWGKTTHANGIGNNNATEIIFLGNPEEEQICGLIHVNDDMFGCCYCYVTDIDGKRKSVVTRKI